MKKIEEKLDAWFDLMFTPMRTWPQWLRRTILITLPVSLPLVWIVRLAFALVASCIGILVAIYYYLLCPLWTGDGE